MENSKSDQVLGKIVTILLLIAMPFVLLFGVARMVLGPILFKFDEAEAENVLKCESARFAARGYSVLHELFSSVEEDEVSGFPQIRLSASGESGRKYSVHFQCRFDEGGRNSFRIYGFSLCEKTSCMLPIRELFTVSPA